MATDKMRRSHPRRDPAALWPSIPSTAAEIARERLGKLRSAAEVAFADVGGIPPVDLFR